MIDRQPLPEPITEQRLIAVMRRLGLARVSQAAPVLREAGIEVIEVTLDGPEALESIHWLADAGYTVGAGTVLSSESGAAARAAGAAFLVAPHFDPRLLEWSGQQSIPFVPGALTPSEIRASWAHGASAVKLFPASLGGPNYLKAVRGPLANIPIIPTGGVAADNAADFLEAGAVAVGLGGWLTDHDDLDEIGSRAQSLVESIARLR